MFPQGDLYINGPLRCYQDTALGLYKNQFYAGGGWSGNECDEIITGIEPADPLSKAISVYPVPAREKLYFNNLKEKATVVISDLSGNIVIRTIVGPDGSIATGHLSPGMYILEIKTKNSLTRQKTIIQH